MHPPTESTDHRPSVLAIHQGAGVSKKQKPGRAQSFRAKKRAERDQDKAIAIIERTETKVEKSRGSSRNIQTRAKAWDHVNKAAVHSTNAFAGLNEDDDDDDDVEDWEDQNSELDNGMNETGAAVPQGEVGKVPLQALAVDGAHDHDDDEVL